MPPNETIRVSIRLRPVTREEQEAYPPPWPVQLGAGELRIFHRTASAVAQREKLLTPRAGAGAGALLSVGHPGSSGGGSAPLSPRVAPSQHFPVVKQWWHQQQQLYPSHPQSQSQLQSQQYSAYYQSYSFGRLCWCEGREFSWCKTAIVQIVPWFGLQISSSSVYCYHQHQPSPKTLTQQTMCLDPRQAVRMCMKPQGAVTLWSQHVRAATVSEVVRVCQSLGGTRAASACTAGV